MHNQHPINNSTLNATTANATLGMPPMTGPGQMGPTYGNPHIAAQQLAAQQRTVQLQAQQLQLMGQQAAATGSMQMSSIQPHAAHRLQSMRQLTQQSAQQSAQSIQSGPQSTSMCAGSASIPTGQHSVSQLSTSGADGAGSAGGTSCAPILEVNPLTSEMLADEKPQEKKRLIAQRLYPKIQVFEPRLAGKITRMLLEMDNTQLLVLLSQQKALINKINQALAVIKDEQQKQSQQKQSQQNANSTFHAAGNTGGHKTMILFMINYHQQQILRLQNQMYYKQRVFPQQYNPYLRQYQPNVHPHTRYSRTIPPSAPQFACNMEFKHSLEVYLGNKINEFDYYRKRVSVTIIKCGYSSSNQAISLEGDINGFSSDGTITISNINWDYKPVCDFHVCSIIDINYESSSIKDIIFDIVNYKAIQQILYITKLKEFAIKNRKKIINKINNYKKEESQGIDVKEEEKSMIEAINQLNINERINNNYNNFSNNILKWIDDNCKNNDNLYDNKNVYKLNDIKNLLISFHNLWKNYSAKNMNNVNEIEMKDESEEKAYSSYIEWDEWNMNKVNNNNNNKDNDDDDKAKDIYLKSFWPYSFHGPYYRSLSSNPDWRCRACNKFDDDDKEKTNVIKYYKTKRTTFTFEICGKCLETKKKEEKEKDNKRIQHKKDKQKAERKKQKEKKADKEFKFESKYEEINRLPPRAPIDLGTGYIKRINIKFDKCGKNMEIDDNGQIIRKIKSGWNTAYSQYELNLNTKKEGGCIYRWELKILSKGRIYLGIDSSNLKYINFDYARKSNKSPYFAFGSPGNLWSKNKSGNKYGTGYKQGDIVKMEINTLDKTIEFFVNDESQGIAFKDDEINIDKIYNPAMTTDGVQEEVKIVKFEQEFF